MKYVELTTEEIVEPTPSRKKNSSIFPVFSQSIKLHLHQALSITFMVKKTLSLDDRRTSLLNLRETVRLEGRSLARFVRVMIPVS